MKSEALQYWQQFGPYIWEFALAVIFLFTGMIYSRKQLGKREKKRVLDELTTIQRAIYNRATAEWTEDNSYREVWMVSLFFERIKTLQDMLSDRDEMDPSLHQQFESYEKSLRNFAQTWAKSKKRRDDFWTKYKTSYEAFHSLIHKIDKHYVASNQATLEILGNGFDYSHQSSQ